MHYNIKLHGNLSTGSRVVPCGQRVITKPIVALRRFASMPKNDGFLSYIIASPLDYVTTSPFRFPADSPLTAVPQFDISSLSHWQRWWIKPRRRRAWPCSCSALVSSWVLFSFDQTELERILWDVGRTDLVTEVVVVIFYTVLPEYL